MLHLSPAVFGARGVFGGGERYALELARYMSDVVPTRLLTFADRPFRDRIGNLDVIALGPPWYVRGQRGNPVHLGIVRQVGWATVVHCHQRHVLASSLTAGLCRLTGRKVFVSDLGGGGWDISGLVPGVRRWYHGFLHISRYSLKMAAQEGVSGEVIYGGVDTAKFSPNATVPKEPLAVYVGRLLPHKGVNDLVAALPAGMSLELIGRAHDSCFQADLRRMAVGKPVVFRTDCDDAEVVRAYRRAACVVLPSVYRTMYGQETLVPELLGQTLLEGMACGTPAICTDVASMPEVVEDGVTGFVVPPNDPAALAAKLMWVRDHPADARQMGRTARERVVRQFTWPAVVTRCLAAYAAPGGGVE